MTDMAVSIAQIAGQNARSIRITSGLTLDEVATHARVYGLPWTTGRVGDFESGRVSPSLPTMFAFALALTDATGKSIRVADLLGGTDDVAINDELTVPVADLLASLSGGKRSTKRTTTGSGTSTVEMIDGKIVSATIESGDSFGYVVVPAWLMREADYRIAKDLGVAVEHGEAAMIELWGKPFTAERDAQAGPDANAQHKGQISRRLKAELEQHLKSGRKRRGNR